MPAPTIVSVAPLNNAADVVLGSQIVVTFDSLIDHTSVTASTFSVVGPGQTLTITPAELVSQDPQPVMDREYISGSFTFDDTSGHTIVTFNPDVPFQPNGSYSIMVVGADGAQILSTDAVKNISGVGMAQTYRWTFVTGDLNLTTPPVPPVGLAYRPRIDPATIRIIPRPPVGNDLSQEIDLIFPAPIDPASFNLSDLLVSIDSILGDPSVTIPNGLVSAVAIVGNKITITITGW